MAFVTVSPAVTARLVLTATGLEMPWSSCRLPAGMVFVRFPVPAFAEVVTMNTSVQVPGEPGVPAGIVPPVSVTELEVEETDPAPHWVGEGVPETNMPAGRAAGRNALVRLSCWTFRVAWASAALVTPWKVWMAPAGMVLT